MKSSFDVIAPLAPVNKTAVLVTAQSRDNFEFPHSGARETLDTQPKLTTDMRKYKALDLRGYKYASLTVIGLADEQNLKKNSRWVVRCRCGRYEYRKARAIRNPANATDCCVQCYRLRVAQKRQTVVMYGEKAAFRAQEAAQQAAIRSRAQQPILISGAERWRHEIGAPLPAFIKEQLERERGSGGEV